MPAAWRVCLAGAAVCELRLDKTVRFVAFTLEEPPAYRSKNMGSYHYAASLKKAREQVEGMICLEMTGSSATAWLAALSHPVHEPQVPEGRQLHRHGGKPEVQEVHHADCRELYDGHGPAAGDAERTAIVVGIDFSDHWSFGKFGYPAFMVTDTAFYRNPNYHSPSDLPDTLDYNRMAKSSKA